MRLMPLWLEMGLSYNEFWDMPIGDIVYILKQKERIIQKQARQQLAYNYNVAVLTASFVGYVLDGKKIPSIEEVMPDVMDDEDLQRAKEEQQQKDMQRYIAQFRAYAEARNLRKR